MKSWKTVAVAVAAVAAGAGALVMTTCLSHVGDRRSVRPMGLVTPGASSSQFDPRRSAALFVGVRKFSHDGTAEVPYAVDDAVDLAYLFSMDPRVSLVPPSRVVLAISGQPHKDDSKIRLAQLRAANARIIKRAGPNDILTAIEEQAAKVGDNGILILSLATHGFVHDGLPYVLGSTSRFEYPETALPATRLFDIAARAKRSLIFVDACRERIALGTRSAGADASTAAPLLERMGGVTGQVIFSAAAAGGYAYDDPVSKNGVFTKAILDGLRCSATTTRTAVTVENLRTHVERQVLEWVRANRDPSIESATQVSIDGGAGRMPLAACPPDPSRIRIASAPYEGSVVTALDSDRNVLWPYDAGTRVLQTAVEDLDADGRQEVVVATGGKLVTLDRDGTPRWNAEEGMLLRMLTTGNLHRRATRQIVTLWTDERSSRSRLVVYNAERQRLCEYDHGALLQSVSIYRPTNHHNPRIVTAGPSEVLVFDAKKLIAGQSLWHYIVPSGKTVTGIEIVDRNHDRKMDVAVRTAGASIYLDPDGRVLD